MSKTIEQLFSFPFKGSFMDELFIKARNYNSHLLSTSGSGQIPITVEQMKNLGNWLIETANKIENDKDFKTDNQ